MNTRGTPLGLGVVVLLVALAIPEAARLLGRRPNLLTLGPAQATEVAAACRTFDPYFAVASLPGAPPAAPGGVSVVGFHDDPDVRLALATHAQTGPVLGLAFDARRGQLYAAAYHKRGAPFGPGGPGQLYRVDLATGEVLPFAALPAGPDRHEMKVDDDAPAADFVGRTGLGDIELDPEADVLVVANLYDGRLYRISVPDGAILGSFAHGAIGEPWRANAHPFGLGWSDGWLFHGVVDSRERTTSAGSLQAVVYRSRSDGGEMRQAASIGLGYPRPIPWRPWSKPTGDARKRTPLGQAMLADIEFDAAGNPILGLRDRLPDTLPALDAASLAYGLGDILPTRPEGDGWVVLAEPERYADDDGAPEQAAGTLGGFRLFDRLVAAVALPRGDLGLGAYWHVNASGVVERHQTLVRPAESSGGLGDVEMLCPTGAAADPEVVATATAFSATATARAEDALATATRDAATATAFAAGTREARGIVVNRSCGSDNPFFVVTCFARDLSAAAMAAEPAIVAFNDTPNEDPAYHILLATQAEVGATFGLAHDWRRGQLYAAAYHKRGTVFGPGGPGQIYRIDLALPRIVPWVQLAAGTDHHDNATNFDEPAAEWVGKTSLGDIELDEEATTLFVVNLEDRRIHRFSVPDGAELGSFPHGAAAETWAANARPFGLGYREGWLYHGVVNSQESRSTGTFVALVYRSRPDGSDMGVVATARLGYAHNPPWVPWKTVPIFQGGAGSQPMLTDIAFRPDGSPLLGLRDRQADMSVYIGYGDLLPSRPGAGGWDVVTVPEHYADQWIHDESLWGTLAEFPGRDWVVSSALAPIGPNTGGVAWLDNPTGAVTRKETIYSGGAGNFNKSQGLGDVEALCPDFALETPTSTATPTAPPTFTATPAPTATPRPSPTPRRLRPIYLPLLLGEVCPPTYVDVVLVLDMSTSMQRETRGSRPKHVAAVEAATAFVDLLDLTPDGTGRSDRAAIVGFNFEAWTAQPLTADRRMLVAGLAGLRARMHEYTRLDLAVTEGAAAALGSGHDPASVPVVILLTDGLPNQVPYAEDGSMATTVLRAAVRAQARGARLFTIGVGAPDDIDARLLEGMAGDAGRYAYAPDAEDLGAIYAGLAGTIRCPPGRHAWDEPWP